LASGCDAVRCLRTARTLFTDAPHCDLGLRQLRYADHLWSMDRPSCGAANPEGKKFCGDWVRYCVGGGRLVHAVRSSRASCWFALCEWPLPGKLNDLLAMKRRSVQARPPAICVADMYQTGLSDFER